MALLDIIFIGVGLAMDCFAVSICIGTFPSNRNLKILLKTALYFSFFQGIMALIGWLFGISILSLIKNLDHWIAFGLLIYIGIKMIVDARKESDACSVDPSKASTMITLSIATSIDALAVGVSLGATSNANIFGNTGVIALISFVFSIFGSQFGGKLGNKFGSKMEIVGGLILIFIGLRIFISHQFFSA